MGNKKLRAIGTGARIRHAQYAWTFMPQPGIELVGELVPGSSGSGTCGIPSLRHEILDDTVKAHPVIESFTRKKHEVIDCPGDFAGVQLDHYVTQAGFESSDVVLLRINHKLWFRFPLFGHCSPFRFLTDNRHVILIHK